MLFVIFYYTGPHKVVCIEVPTSACEQVCVRPQRFFCGKLLEIGLAICYILNNNAVVFCYEFHLSVAPFCPRIILRYEEFKFPAVLVNN